MERIPVLQSAQCDGKTPYPTWQAAHRQRRHAGKCNIYRCPHCNSFYLGTIIKGQRQGRPKPPPPAIELEL